VLIPTSKADVHRLYFLTCLPRIPGKGRKNLKNLFVRLPQERDKELSDKETRDRPNAYIVRESGEDRFKIEGSKLKSINRDGGRE
jgi:hypothetical protein